ncbi:GIY-YIG nuclease family protein [Aequorivita echinoideorum]|nr:GIY-YIG nuclease family protein [Aequorivita echinoideorum]
MASVYILYSKSADIFYTGSCADLSVRVRQHLDKVHTGSFTSRASDWILFYSIENLDRQQARKIELHIKAMKSRTYIENLRKYPEMVCRLVERFGAGSSR